MDFKELKKILAKYHFFGFTVKRGNKRLTYTFRSVPYFCVVIVVDVIRVNLETFKTTKLVGRITINNKEINDLKELVNTLKQGVYSIHKKEFVKTFKQVA